MIVILHCVVKSDRSFQLIERCKSSLKSPEYAGGGKGSRAKQERRRDPLIDRTQELIPMSLRPITEVPPLGRFVTFPRPCAGYRN